MSMDAKITGAGRALLHRWDLSPEEAVALQRQLAPRVIRTTSLVTPPRLIAGVDLSAPDAQGRVTGAVVVVRYPGLDIAEVRVHNSSPEMPYIPGLLSFRESPAILGALEQLSTTPDLLLVDGQGLAHPRRFGIACHLGLLLDLPTVGCAKSILRGRHGPLAAHQGASAELIDGGEVVGAALRTRQGVSPLYVSIGHRVDLATALDWVLACCKRYRLPEPTRLAHQAAAGRLAPRGPSRPPSASATHAPLL